MWRAQVCVVNQLAQWGPCQDAAVILDVDTACTFANWHGIVCFCNRGSDS